MMRDWMDWVAALGVVLLLAIPIAFVVLVGVAVARAVE